MARLSSELDASFLLDVPPDVARRHFADVDRVGAATAETQRIERLDDETLHVVLQEQVQGPHRFTPDYVVRYRREGDDVVWETLRGNFTSEGRARFVAEGAGTRLHYRHAVSFDSPVPGLVAKMLQPVVHRLAQPGLRRFVEAMIATAPRQGA